MCLYPTVCSYLPRLFLLWAAGTLSLLHQGAVSSDYAQSRIETLIYGSDYTATVLPPFGNVRNRHHLAVRKCPSPPCHMYAGADPRGGGGARRHMPPIHLYKIGLPNRPQITVPVRKKARTVRPPPVQKTPLVTLEGRDPCVRNTGIDLGLFTSWCLWRLWKHQDIFLALRKDWLYWALMWCVYILQIPEKCSGEEAF